MTVAETRARRSVRLSGVALGLSIAMAASMLGGGAAHAQTCRWAPQTDGPLDLYVCRNADGSLDIVDARPRRADPPARAPSAPRLTREEREARARLREENRRIQTVLNAVGCEAGTPDGVVGRRTRAAVDCLRALAGGGSGELDAFERDALLATYETVFEAPEDPFAPTEEATALDVLAIYENGGTRPVGSEPVDAFASDGETAPEPDPVAETEPPAGDAVADSDEDDAPMIGDLFGSRPDEGAGPAPADPADAPLITVAMFCDRVRVTASAERFCDMRDAFVADAEQLNATAGRSFEEAAGICSGVRDALVDEVADLGATPIDAIRARVRDQISYEEGREASFSTSMSICVGSGYAVDDGALAVAAALALDALGDARAPVLIGHHIELGLATRPEPSRAEEWLSLAER